jgi:hypothetical protein
MFLVVISFKTYVDLLRFISYHKRFLSWLLEYSISKSSHVIANRLFMDWDVPLVSLLVEFYRWIK